MISPATSRQVRVAVGTLMLSAAGFVQYLSNEDFKAKAYNDGVGVWTEGFGSTHGVKPGDTITVPKALRRSLSELQVKESAVKRCLGPDAKLFTYEYDALVDFAGNAGDGNMCKSSMVRLSREGRYAEACDAYMGWIKEPPSVRDGIIARRQKERAMCLGHE